MTLGLTLGNSRFRVALASTIVAAGALAVVPAAVAAPPHCGSHVARDVTLHADITGCHGSGLVIAADGVTVDLHGHTIRGSGFAGIDNVAGHDRVTVKSSGERGKLGNGFLYAVEVIRGDDNVVRNIEGWEVSFTRSSGGVIAHTRLQQGFYLSRDHQVRVVHNKVIRGPSTSTLEVHDSSRMTIDGNDVFNAHRGIWLDNVDHSRVLNNRVNMADEPAIWLMRHSNHNRVAGNLLYRIDFGGFSGIDLQVSNGNRVVHNVVRGALYAIAVGQPDPFFAVGFGRGISRRNRIVDNVLRGSRVGVIAVRGSSDDTLIEGNVAKLGDTGIRVGDPSTALGGNLVKKNTGHGISAVRGVQNLGGNVAIRNRGRPQCIHVRCRTVPPAT